jgi:hypothetical protein
VDEIDFNQFFKSDEDSENSQPDMALAVPDTKLQAYDKLCKILDSSVLASMDEEAGRRLLTVSGELKGYSMPEAIERADEALRGLSVDATMYLYLFLMDRGFSPDKSCRIMGINKTDPVIWRRSNKLFAACMKAIIEAMADEAENMSINLAATDPKANLERMFVVKAHKPIYRDNAPMPTPTNIQLNVTIDSKAIDSSGAYKIVTDAEIDDE